MGNLLQISSESRLVCENEFVPQQKNFQLSSAKRNGESHIENSNVESVGRIDAVDTAIAIYPNSIDYVSSENKTNGLIRQNNKESKIAMKTVLHMRRVESRTTPI